MPYGGRTRVIKLVIELSAKAYKKVYQKEKKNNSKIKMASTIAVKDKTVEKLVITTVKPKIKSSQTKPENEQINSAVMKVLQGYDWTLVPATSTK